MTPPITLAMIEAEHRLLTRLQELGARLDAGEDHLWTEYLSIITTINVLVPAERRPWVTTKEMATKLGVAPKTVRRLGTDGKLEHVRFGARGTGAIRWKA